jgi:hypothetical protein
MISKGFGGVNSLAVEVSPNDSFLVYSRPQSDSADSVPNFKQ